MDRNAVFVLDPRDLLIKTNVAITVSEAVARLDSWESLYRENIRLGVLSSDGMMRVAILERQLRELRAFVDKLPSELRKYWSFDENQQHTHSWHSREDFIERFTYEAAKATRG